MIRFPCPICGEIIKAPSDAIGKTGKCKCGERVRIPDADSMEVDNRIKEKTSAKGPTSKDTQTTPSQRKSFISRYRYAVLGGSLIVVAVIAVFLYAANRKANQVVAEFNVNDIMSTGRWLSAITQQWKEETSAYPAINTFRVNEAVNYAKSKVAEIAIGTIIRWEVSVLSVDAERVDIIVHHPDIMMKVIIDHEGKTDDKLLSPLGFLLIPSQVDYEHARKLKVGDRLIIVGKISKVEPSFNLRSHPNKCYAVYEFTLKNVRVEW